MRVRPSGAGSRWARGRAGAEQLPNGVALLDMEVWARAERLDEQVGRRVQPTRASRALGATSAVVSIAGEAVLVGLLVQRTARAPSPQRQLALLGGTFGVEQAVLRLAKQRVGRGRPGDGARPPVALHPSGAGFPSGHSSAGFFAASALADRSSGPLLFVGAVVVALARLHQGVHRASDLLVGAALGTAGGGLARRLAQQRR